MLSSVTRLAFSFQQKSILPSRCVLVIRDTKAPKLSYSNRRNMLSTKASASYYTVGITGSSGLLGTALIDELSKIKDGKLNGKPIRIVKLVRSTTTETILEKEEMISSIHWNPDGDSSTVISACALDRMDTIVHLAGENVGTGLLPGPLGWLGIHAWSKEKKDLIFNSRVGPTKVLADSIANSSTHPDFIVASGVGVYGNDFMEGDDTSPDESTDISRTSGFLAELSRDWEAAAQTAATSENRVVNLRIAPIMSKLGGALGKLHPIFFLGLGGIVGSGQQYFSFISARDAARAIVHIIENPCLTGPVNLVAPIPCTNAQFTNALGRVLSRPTIVPFPEFAVKMLFGEMGEEMLLGGVKATPQKLLKNGFEFYHENIDKALESAVKETI